MAARGARSRKVVEKQIEKKEKKQAAKDFADSFKSRSSSGWGSPVRRSSTSQTTTRPSGHSHGHGSVDSPSPGGSRAPSESGRSKVSIRLKEDERYKAEGKKESSAPRGRRGGVPTKASSSTGTGGGRNTADLASPTGWELISDVHRPQTTATIRNITWSGIKLWVGNGRAPQQYKGFENDSEMWMTSGDCFVYFSEETSEVDAAPTLRVHVSVLEQAKSVFLVNLLKYGEIYQEQEITPPSSRSSSTAPQIVAPNPSYPLTKTNLGFLDEEEESSPWQAGERISGSTLLRGSTVRTTRSSASQTPSARNFRGFNEYTPPLSSAASDIASTAARSNEQAEITHEIWFPAPAHLKTSPQILRRHHIATRNFIALLYGKPIVGEEYLQMLSDLQTVMDNYYELNDPSQRRNSVDMVVNYLADRKLDDVRGNLDAALGLLAWCEQETVRWEEGFVEAFVHTVGMMTEDTIHSAAFKQISPVTRHNLVNAYNSLQLRVLSAEEQLTNFDFTDMYTNLLGTQSAGHVSKDHPALLAFRNFQFFLWQFYQRTYGEWPPPPSSANRPRGNSGITQNNPDGRASWLSRTIALRLQEDFGAMYDYLVDRNAAWDADEMRPSRKWQIVSTKPRSGSFDADVGGFPFTDMVVSWDLRKDYLHIPHPLPLLPVSRASLHGETGLNGNEKKGAKNKFLGSFGGFKKGKAVTVKDPKEQFQISLAFNGATNINRLGTTFEENTLLDSLSSFEKSPQNGNLPPGEARLGRWLLLYGILQVLSTISVDVSPLRYTQGVSYFLSPPLTGCPPWPPTRDSATPRRNESHPFRAIEAIQTRSWCWTRRLLWVDDSAGNSGQAHVYADKRGLHGVFGYELSEEGDQISELDGRSIQRSAKMSSPTATSACLSPSVQVAMQASQRNITSGGYTFPTSPAVGTALSPTMTYRDPSGIPPSGATTALSSQEIGSPQAHTMHPQHPHSAMPGAPPPNPSYNFSHPYAAYQHHQSQSSAQRNMQPAHPYPSQQPPRQQYAMPPSQYNSAPQQGHTPPPMQHPLPQYSSSAPLSYTHSHPPPPPMAPSLSHFPAPPSHPPSPPLRSTLGLSHDPHHIPLAYREKRSPPPHGTGVVGRISSLDAGRSGWVS